MTVTRTVKQVTINVTRNGNSIKIQPVLIKDGEAFDGIVDGGTA